MDYECERGAKRNFEVWRDPSASDHKLETEDERLDRLEAERAEAGGVMEELEMKVHDAKREMEIADALDEIRTRNARISRAEGREAEGEALEAAEKSRREREEEKRRIEEEDAEAARRAFSRGIELEEDGVRSSIGTTYGDLNAAQVGDSILPAGNGQKKTGDMAPPPTKPSHSVQVAAPAPEFKRTVKKKKDFSAALGIKKKSALV